MKQLVLWLLLLATTMSFAQSINKSKLTIDQIMLGADFVGYSPSRINWSDDSQDIFFNWTPNKDTLSSSYKVNVKSKAISKRTFSELKNSSGFGEYTKDYKWKVYSKSGDLYLMDMSNYSVKQITKTEARESSPQFSGDESSIVYHLDGNLFKWDIKSGFTQQLTNFKKGSKKSDSEQTTQDQWLKEDQLTQFNVLTKRKNEGDARQYRNEQTKIEGLEPIYTGSKILFGMNVSPDLNYVVYSLYESAKGRNTIVPDFVTESGYTTDLNTRSKVGSKQATSESWILNLKTGDTYQIKADELEGIFNKPKYREDYVTKDSVFNPLYKSPRNVSIGSPLFSDDSKAVVSITSQDNKDRWILTLDLANGSLKQIDRQHDAAWIGGPEIRWGGMGWIDNNNIWFKSEKTGYSHIYTANVNTGKVKALTSGNFEILNTELSKDKNTFFITSNKVSPHEHHFYHLPVKGGKMTQITSQKGGHEVTISPDEKQLAIRYSYTNKPWELYVMPNKAAAKMEQLTNSTTKEFNSYKWIDSEIIQFTARDGAKVPATLYKPKASNKNGAAVVFVHGAGYLQNVHYWWSSYFREYMFHNFLVDNGYTVLAIDYRASAGYGRDWRTSIYRHMGGKDLDDHIDGAKYLVDQQGIDKDRLGIYGGSYGGFITLMALFNSPDTFKSGAALRSVTDWAHYNHGYTSNILNTPTEDPIAYKRSSPLYFAEGLKNNLLILHGMVDTNVHFQDVVRLSQRLIELKKENWEMAIFPMESHGFIEASSWSDEYRRIYKLFEETLKE
ncbi:S9 family peptidase [Bizionia argentinensis JUB59]|uniref:S9 family peptidase n=1 Tax=Bizionia argentinensis JUB59 TaxID=1046627 RepID=G2EAM5_9FLAO|nr:S9 family peptidase [Bizionia argentinensis]EGV44522.2 S9 family peptidase [Bizionia argentinensis JUB59]